MLNCCENSQDQRFPFLLTLSLSLRVLLKWQQIAISWAVPFFSHWLLDIVFHPKLLSAFSFKWVGKCFFLFHPLTPPPPHTCIPPCLLFSPRLAQINLCRHSFWSAFSVGVCDSVWHCVRGGGAIIVCVCVVVRQLWSAFTRPTLSCCCAVFCGHPAAWWVAKEPPSWERIQPALFVRNGEKESRRETQRHNSSPLF